MVTLRSYQKDAIDTIKGQFRTSDRQFVIMPTGSGKTITFLKYAADNHERILLLVPSKELLKQVYESSLLFYHKSEVSRKGGDWYESPAKLHICIINSLKGHYLKFITDQYFDLIVIDEAHHAYAKSYQNVINGMVFCPKILGVTATPDRTDGQLLKEILNTCSFELKIQDLIQQGHLCDIEGFSVKTKIDLSDVDDHNGDFSAQQLYKKLSVESRNNMIVELCKEHMKDRRTLVFCINIDHSKEINRLLNLNGVTSKHIDGSMNDKERSSILSSFRNGEISTLCNCQLLTEGFDEPSIDGILLTRPTKSRALFTQMIGRGLRTSLGKKNCKIIDVVDNHKRLAGFNSLISDERFSELSEFKSIKDIQDHVYKERLEVIESSLEKANFFNISQIDDYEATDSMIDYLESNSIYFQHPISFDEASFLIWFNELKKEYANG